ncbi:MAG: hypothetical protein GYB67_12925 [Chloroflexi bacterium]|nr:hypothetical protein [Chloroflexota bacterium]
MMTTKPGRPLGVSLAVLASMMLYAILPLSQLAIVWLVEQRLRAAEALGEGMTGGSIEGLADGSLFLQAVLGIGFLVIAVLAWRGRPPAIRLMLIAAVVVLGFIGALLILVELFTPPDLNVFDSGTEVARSLLVVRLIVTVLVPMYVIWYMNRGPARAFYRGYYLPDPDEAAEPAEKSQR